MLDQDQLSLVVEIPSLIENEQCIPIYATNGAAGADVKAFLQDPVTILPGNHGVIPTGLKVAIPDGYEIQVRPRSGLAFNHQITVLNTPGTIDKDYRGEIKVILINLGSQPFEITPGMRIAQLVLAPVLRANFIVSNDLTSTERGTGGFGHTGFN